MAAQKPHLAAHVSLDDFLETQYDYVIVGGGTAGLVLAARLTENPKVTVGVIEAGKLRVDDENVNGLAGGANMWHNPDYDWMFKTVPQKHNHNRIHHLVRGKFVGGSSGINYTALVCPSVEDIDTWDSHAPGWSWSSLEPYFRKSQSLQADKSTEDRPSYFQLDPSIHGDSGPILTSWSPSIVPVERKLIEAMNVTAGTQAPKDPYSGEHVGFSQHLYTVDRRAGFPSRSYATTGYFVPHADRPNLKLLTDANAVKILLDSKGGVPKAVGVSLSNGGRVTDIKATEEVIISASSVQSPRLLELSGIGNKKILQAAGVECIVDLPGVGENLMEHAMSCVTYEMAPGPENITLDSLFLDQTVFQEQLKRLTETQDGLMAGVFGPTGFVPYAAHVSPERLKKTLDGIARPHDRVRKLLRSTSSPTIELITLPGNVDLEHGHTDQSKIMPGAPAGRNACHSTLVSAMYPLARGSTHIERAESLEDGAEPFTTQPRIDLALLSHDADVDVIAAGMTLTDRAYKSSLVAGRFIARISPPPEVDLEDPEQARAYVRRQSMIFNHNSGTCSMGSVVDERLRVKGVAGLRVVDVSVVPNTISANPMATVYALAERAADLIKEDSRLFA